MSVSVSKYTVSQLPVEVLLGWIKGGQIAIPEMQRPFVWNSTKVRDLLDSLYQGFPVGYLITWQSIDADVKGGGKAHHQQILIDGQQRITALQAAIAGQTVVGKDYRRSRIRISFNPQTERFETATPITKQSEWIYDVHEVFSSDDTFSLITGYLTANPEADRKAVANNFTRLMGILKAQVGVISLADDLEIDMVTEIFVRINSKGVPLGTADFVMSKIAANGDRGRNLRKYIDYFSHLATQPQDYQVLARDTEFEQSGLLAKIAWLKDDVDDLYDPTYVDLIRTAGLLGFKRGRLSAVVSELSGRDPETHELNPELIGPAYDKFEWALHQISNKYQFTQFVMIIKSAGFIDRSMMTARNALNFAYALYLRLRAEKNTPESECKRLVRRWFVMSLLTGRASGSFETTFEADMQRIAQQGAAAALAHVERTDLSDAFWDVALPSNLITSRYLSPYYQTFLATQVTSGARGFLSKDITVQMMIEEQGDLHHLVPKEYLRTHGVNDQREYNQVANYAMTETPINIRIGKRAPEVYMVEVAEQITSGHPTLGELVTAESLAKNLAMNAIPQNFSSVTSHTYEQFLDERRHLMAAQIKQYYQAL